MAEESAKLRIPYIAAAQAQKHVTHNEAMTLLDTLVQLSVLDKDLTAPPGDPEEGDCYIVAGGGGSATGAWIGWEQRIARYIDGEWRSYLPGQGNGAGWLAWVLDEDAMYRFDGEDWTLAGIEGPQGPQGDPGEPGEPGVAGPTGPAGASSLTIVRAVAGSDVDIASELEDGDAIDGVTLVAGDRVLLAGQTAPEENGVYLVSASGPATRDGDFDAYDDHPGVYLSVMEGSAYADTLWRCTSDRGGTIDSDGLVFTEFSAGGVTSVNGQTGDVVLRERLAANRTYYVNASSGSDSNDGLTSGAAFATIGKAIDVAYTLDWGIFRVTVQLADGTYALNKTIVGPFLSSQRLLVLGNTGTPSNVTITSTGNGFRTQSGAAVEFSGVTFSPSGFCAHNPSAGGDIKIGANCRFTNSPTFAHVYVVSGGYAEMLHPFEVAASCNAVMRCDFGGIIEGRTGAQTITISNTPVWTEGFAAAHYGGIIAFSGKTFSGSATGPRFACSQGGIIFTAGGGASYFPGNASGTGTNLGTSPYGAYL